MDGCDYYIKLGESIRQIRQIRGITQAELGNRVGVRGQTVSQWEAGTRRPTPEDLDRMAEAMRCTSDVFYHGKHGRRDDPGGRQRAIKAIDAMTDHEKATMWHAFAEWDGDVHALLELVALYIDLDIPDRADVIAHILAIAEDRCLDTRADIGYLTKQFFVLNRRATK